MILKTTNQNVIIESGSKSYDVTNVPVRKFITPVTNINTVSSKEQLRDHLNQAQLAQDEEMEKMYAKLGINTREQ